MSHGAKVLTVLLLALQPTTNRVLVSPNGTYTYQTLRILNKFSLLYNNFVDDDDLILLGVPL